MIEESERTMSSFRASPLFSRWVQSLFMNTEQRAEMGRTRAPSGSRSTASRSRSMRPSCWRKNSPVPEAHLEPERLPRMRPSLTV